MADFLLIYPANNRGEDPIMIHVDDIISALPVRREGALKGRGSWLEIDSEAFKSGPILVHGTPERIAGAMVAKGRVVTIAPYSPDMTNGAAA